jgi:hypothetical protein
MASRALTCTEWIPVGIRITCPLDDKSRCKVDKTFGLTPWPDWTTPPPLPPAPPLSPPLTLQQCDQEEPTNIMQTDWGYVGRTGGGQGRKLTQYADYWTSPKKRCLAATDPAQCDYRCAIYWTYESLRSPPVAAPPPTAAMAICAETTFTANNGYVAFPASSCECCQTSCTSTCRLLYSCATYTVKGSMNGGTCGWDAMSPPPSGYGGGGGGGGQGRRLNALPETNVSVASVSNRAPPRRRFHAVRLLQPASGLSIASSRTRLSGKTSARGAGW